MRIAIRYNDLVREIRKNLARVRAIVEADIKATDEFYIDHEKAEDKQAKQQDVLAKTLMEWVGDLPTECLRFMAGPSDGENMKGLLVFARSEQKRADERRKVQVDEDGSESTCAACHHQCEQSEQLVICDFCTRATAPLETAVCVGVFLHRRFGVRRRGAARVWIFLHVGKAVRGGHFPPAGATASPSPVRAWCGADACGVGCRPTCVG